MKLSHARYLWACALICALAATLPAAASTFQRVDLERLVAESTAVVIGEVQDAHSYWNEGGTFILTDVVIAPSEYLKGNTDDENLVLTLIGGTVGELTTLIVGGPELRPGTPYVLFVARADLPGKPAVQTVTGLVQGTFEVVETLQGRRAVSQANAHPLLADAGGETAPPGGIEGLGLDSLRRSVRELSRRPPREVGR